MVGEGGGGARDTATNAFPVLWGKWVLGEIFLGLSHDRPTTQISLSLSPPASSGGDRVRVLPSSRDSNQSLGMFDQRLNSRLAQHLYPSDGVVNSRACWLVSTQRLFNLGVTTPATFTLHSSSSGGGKDGGSVHPSTCTSEGLPVVSECAPQTARVSSNHSSMSVPRVPSPPPPEVNTPVAENWCYTQAHNYIWGAWLHASCLHDLSLRTFLGRHQGKASELHTPALDCPTVTRDFLNLNLNAIQSPRSIRK
uniref:Uncharacterized protein n=1 Tax=Timema monikensis TaxID=170555 RepID=A0A7R9ED46_9NEOP|nr:unnamed protein product [Timema monikensis]